MIASHSSPARPPIRVWLIDGQAVVRAGLRMIIDHQPGLQVAGEAACCGEALAMMRGMREWPQVVVINLDLGHPGRVAPPTGSLGRFKPARVVLLVGNSDLEDHYNFIGQAIKDGVMGIVLREGPVEAMVGAIGRVYAGEPVLDRSLTGRVLAKILLAHQAPARDPEAAKLAALGQREREVISLVCEGLGNKQIAERLSVSVATVRHRLGSIFAALGVSDRLGLVIFAHRHGLAPRPPGRPRPQ